MIINHFPFFSDSSANIVLTCNRLCRFACQRIPTNISKISTSASSIPVIEKRKSKTATLRKKIKTYLVDISHNGIRRQTLSISKSNENQRKKKLAYNSTKILKTTFYYFI